MKDKRKEIKSYFETKLNEGMNGADYALEEVCDICNEVLSSKGFKLKVLNKSNLEHDCIELGVLGFVDKVQGVDTYDYFYWYDYASDKYYSIYNLLNWSIFDVVIDEYVKDSACLCNTEFDDFLHGIKEEAK